jgi:hypothetical protein
MKSHNTVDVFYVQVVAVVPVHNNDDTIEKELHRK